MKLPLPSPGRVLASLLPCMALLACGAGQSTPGTNSQTGSSPSQPTAPVTTPTAPGTPAVPSVPPVSDGTVPAAPQPPTNPAPGSSSGIITDLKFESTSSSSNQSNVPVTFGQVFGRGDLFPNVSLSGQLADGSLIPLQMDAKAIHADGSVRHAILSAVLPSLSGNEARVLNLAKTAAAAPATAATPSALLGAGFSASVNLAADSQVYSVSADELLKGTNYKTWLAGPIANEWHVSAPLKTAAGMEHPHLTARFAIRWYNAIKKARVDVTIENNWAYEAAPSNITYDAQVLVGGQKVYDKASLTHLHHARWRKTFWWGAAPQVHIKHNTKYMMASLAVPNYDQSLTVSETALATLSAKWTGSKTEPMGVGMAAPFMPDTGGRPDIGLLPAWSAMYLLSMDKRAKDVMLGTADLAGSWSAHYRDKKTDRPISLKNYPYMTIIGNPSDTMNPATKKYESFPTCATAGGCKSPHTQDTSHQPAFAYLPYLVTGDYYYLEELQFWAMWNVFSSNPGYRENAKGLVISDQVRGQAWSLRTLSEAAYITPAADPLKGDFDTLLSNNLDWYNANYTNNTSANSLGLIANGYAFGYSNGRGMSPWMDDFFTSAVGHAAELGFAKADALLMWKSKFPIARMIAPGTCWISGASYSLIAKDSATGPVYNTMAQVYAASQTPEFAALACGSAEMAAALKLKVGEMPGYSSGTEGYPANMQPALAFSANVGGKSGADAWKVFMARSVKPDYSASPQFAIVPR